MTSGKIIKITERLRLSPFQVAVLQGQGAKYNLNKLVKRGDVLLAPYARGNGIVGKLLLGARADLIGKDKILVRAERGIRLHSTGFYSVGGKYFDPMGQEIDRALYRRIV